MAQAKKGGVGGSILENLFKAGFVDMQTQQGQQGFQQQQFFRQGSYQPSDIPTELIVLMLLLLLLIVLLFFL